MAYHVEMSCLYEDKALLSVTELQPIKCAFQQCIDYFDIVGVSNKVGKGEEKSCAFNFELNAAKCQKRMSVFYGCHCVMLHTFHMPRLDIGWCRIISVHLLLSPSFPLGCQIVCNIADDCIIRDAIRMTAVDIVTEVVN